MSLSANTRVASTPTGLTPSVLLETASYKSTAIKVQPENIPGTASTPSTSTSVLKIITGLVLFSKNGTGMFHTFTFTWLSSLMWHLKFNKKPLMK